MTCPKDVGAGAYFILLQPPPKTCFPPYGPIPGRERARGTNPWRARKKPQDGGVPRESGGQGKGAAGDKGRPRVAHGPAQLLDSISARIAAYVIDNMPKLRTLHGDTVWRAVLRSPRTQNVLMSIPGSPIKTFRENSTMSSC